MRVRLTDATDGAVYLECPYREWNPVREAFKATIPYDGRAWDEGVKKWLIRALYVAELLTFLAQHGAQVQDDRQPAQTLEVRAPMPDDLRAAFAMLHLASTAPLCVAEASYKALARYYHPDVGGTAESFHAVNDAIRVIRHYLNPQEEPHDDLPF
jgi:hypothetical protein